MKFLFFGYGYCAEKISQKIELETNLIIKTHRNAKKIANQNSILFNQENLISAELVNEATHILISIPPDHTGDMVYQNYHDILAKSKKLQWIGYLSSTSVYGDHRGAFVDEKSEVKPITLEGTNRLIAEQQWLSTGLPVQIFRLAAIYGLKRSFIERIMNHNLNPDFPYNKIFSRIYIKDLAAMILLASKNFKSPTIYNLADNKPATSIELINYCQKILPEKFLTKFKFELNQTEMKAEKKISNQKFCEDFNYQLKYPSYQDGLKDILSYYL